MRFVFLHGCCIILVWIARSQPFFPPMVEPIIKSINDRQAGYDRPKTNQSAKLAKLARSASEHVQESLEEELAREALIKAAYGRVHLRLVKYVYVGGCPRDTSGCPKDRTMTKALHHVPITMMLAA